MADASLGLWTVPLAVFGGAIRVSTPFLFVSLGECITERSGRINLGLEGTLVMGAMSAYGISYLSGSPWLGVLAAGFSTLEGVILAISTIFANDFYGTFARAKGIDPERLQGNLLRAGRIFLVALAPITLFLAYRQIVAPSLSVAIFAQNGIYGLFSATFAPVLFGIFSRRTNAWLVFASAISALIVHFGMYYGGITVYHNNPAVPATFALLTSTLVMLAGSAFQRKVQTDG